MDKLQVFNNSEFGDLEILVLDGKEYFPATECAEKLGYSNPWDAVIRHCKYLVKHEVPTGGGNKEVNFIPEGDLYRLIIRSKLPAAERFERWVFDEVLPSLRRTGTYSSKPPATTAEFLLQTAQVLVGHDERITDLAARVEALEQRIPAGYPQHISLLSGSQSALLHSPGQMAMAADALGLIHNWIHENDSLFLGRLKFPFKDVRELAGRWDYPEFKWIAVAPECVNQVLRVNEIQPEPVLRIWRAEGWIVSDTPGRFTKRVRLGKFARRLIVFPWPLMWDVVTGRGVNK